MLAFKSDVSHWRKKNELTGVSVRYVFSDMNFFTSIDLINVERYAFMLSGARCAYQRFFTADHHERLRAASHLTISH
jgi:hypothetical protein